ncbi:MAG: hypothetical protein ABIF10_01845 [Candidatus Woesearchaeota archaeon]
MGQDSNAFVQQANQRYIPGGVSQNQPAGQPQVTQKYCVNCGTVLSQDTEGKLYCPKCGFKLSSPTNERRAAIVKILLYLVGGIFAVFAVWFFFTKFKEMLNLF